MIYQQTQEKIKSGKIQTWYAIGIVTFLFWGLICVFCFTSLSQSMPTLFRFLLIGCIMLFSAWVVLLAKQMGMKTDRVNEVETQTDALILVSPLKRVNIPYSSITKLFVRSDLEGQVQSLSLHSDQRRFVILQGYERMNQLARELEKKIANSDRVTKVQKNVIPSQRFMGGALAGGALVGMFGVIFGVIVVVNKIGFGFLLGPLGVIVLGVGKFASGRGRKKERLLGIAIIFGGLLFAVFKFYMLFLNSAKGS